MSSGSGTATRPDQTHTISAARVINIHTEWENNITFIQRPMSKPLTFSQCKNPTGHNQKKNSEQLWHV